MTTKTGTKKNLTLRVLCLKNIMPMYAPKGPKNAINKSFDSEILHFLLMLLALSTPKIVSDTTFATTKKINKGRNWIVILISKKMLKPQLPNYTHPYSIVTLS